MKKLIFLLSLTLFLMGNGAATSHCDGSTGTPSPGFKVGNQSEWEEGSFTDTTSDLSCLSLEASGNVQIDWRKDSYVTSLKDVEKYNDDSNFVYLGGQDNNWDGVVWKYDKQGNLEWKYNGGGEIRSLAVGPDHVYAGTNYNDIRKIDKTDGSEEMDINVPDGNVMAIDYRDGFIYAADGDFGTDNVTKIDASNGVKEWETELSNTLTLGIAANKKGEVFVAAGDDIFKLSSDGSLVDQEPMNGGGQYRGMDIGPNGNLYPGGGAPWYGGLVEKFDSSLNRKWTASLDNRTSDVDVSSSGDVYASTGYGDDATYKFDNLGSRIWKKSDPESQLGVESNPQGVYSTGKLNDLSPPDGVLTRFIEEKEPNGNYNSKVFDAGTVWWTQARIKFNNQSGETGEITFRNKNPAGNVIDQKTKPLSDGTNTVDLKDFNRKKVDFVIDLSTNDVLQTPEVDWVKIQYSNSPLNEAPIISNPSPPDGSTRGGNKWEIVNATVEDPDGDNINVSIWDENGNLLNNTNFTAGGPENITVNYTGLHSGYNEWKVNATDGSSSDSETFEFLVPGDPPIISNPEPTDDSTVYFSPVDLSIDISDPDDSDDPLYVSINNSTGHEIVEEPLFSVPGTLQADYVDGLTRGNSYQWHVNVTDGEHHVNRTYNFSFQALNTERIESDFLTNYTSIFASTTNQELIPYTLSSKTGTRSVNVSLYENNDMGVTFADNSKYKVFDLDENGRTLLLKIDPSDTGTKQIKVNVEDRTLGVTSSDKIDVHVRETPPRFQRNNVPGLGLVQFVSILMLGSLAYFALL